MKNGFGGIRLAVDGASIDISAPGIPKRVARLLGLDHALDASALRMTTQRVGWLGTRLFARDCVVVSWRRGDHAIELAINPTDGDLSRLQSALAAAGVQARPAVRGST
jgi:hypothetical protein